MTGEMITGKVAIGIATVNAWSVIIIGGDVIATVTATMATIAAVRFITAIRRTIPADMVIPAAVAAMDTRAAAMDTRRLSSGGGYGNPGSVYGRSGNGRSQAYGFGYQDGSYMARKDRSENKRFNPNPRNEYGNRTHGYNDSFGNKNYYRAEYSNGYSDGYEANYRGGRGWGF